MAKKRFMSVLYKGVFVAIDKLYYKGQNPKDRMNTDGIEIEKDICYDTNFPDDCLLDTYRPKNAEGKYPVFMYIHGGGFVAGSKDFRVAHALWLANMGCFVVNVNHSFCPPSVFPEPLQQAVNALNWIYDNAEKYNLDLSRVLIGGDSSGAYLASAVVAATLSEDIRTKCNVQPKIKFGAAVYNCGLYDIKTALGKVALGLGKGLFRDITGIKMKNADDYELNELCNTMNFIGEGYPSTFVTASKKDFLCVGQGEVIIDKLEKSGVYSENYVSQKFLDNHCFSLNWNSKAAVASNNGVEAFVKKFINGEIPNPVKDEAAKSASQISD